MPTYIVTNPETGQKIRLTGETPPTDADLDGIFSQQQVVQTSPQQQAPAASDDFIPTEENLALEQARVDAIPERTLGQKAEGVVDAALTLGSGATTGAAGFFGGSLYGILGELTGMLEPGQGLEEAQALAEKLTIAPETEAGREYVKAISDKLGALPPVMGGAVPATALTTNIPIAAKMAKSNNPLLKALGESAPERTLKTFERKAGNGKFEPRIWGMVKDARKMGFDDSVTEMIASASPIDRRKMVQQVNVVERGLGDARTKALERTADIAGDALVKKVNYVKSNNNQAGVQLGRVAKSLADEKIDISQPINKFTNSLSEKLGVTFDDDLTPNFKGSDIETFPESKKVINDIMVRIKRDSDPSALDAHKFKRLIDKYVKYGKTDGKLDGDVERAAKSLRSEVNDTISSISEPYAEANKRFSETISALDELQDVAGRKLNFSGPHADKAAGTLLRSQTNNTKGRANLFSAIENLESVAKKYGGSFDDDVLNLSIFADELDSVFGTGARTSLRGEVGKAGIDTAVDISQMSIPGAVAVGVKAGAKRLRGVNEKNQLKAIKKLLKANQKPLQAQ